MPDKLDLTRADVEAVIDYIYQHVRASPKGRGYKVWERMLEFLERDVGKELEYNETNLDTGTDQLSD